MADSSRGSLLQAQRGILLQHYVSRRGRVANRGRRTSRAADAVLDGEERQRIVQAFIAVLGGAYCHLPQKRAAYACDPVQALHLLGRTLHQLSDAEFHLAMTSIVTRLRDAHTRYSGPHSTHDAVAVLPFLVEQFGPHDRPRFIVSKVSSRALIKDTAFKEGVELETWNGVPIARAVEVYADRETGGRPDSRRARALESLTLRDLEYGPPPDEWWVDVGYRTGRGVAREIRLPWRVVRPRRAPTGHKSGSRSSRFLAANPSGEHVRRAKKLMFSGQLWKGESDLKAPSRARDPLATQFQDVLMARIETVRGVGEVGYLRVWSFDVEDDDEFLKEVMRLLAAMPERGLILDLRANPGGLIWAAERMLQLFTSRPVVPTRFTLVASELTREMARSPFNQLELGNWSPSLEMAAGTGDVYSQPLPLTEEEWCNDLGQHYRGPVVCVVDANTYSSGDLFAAGFVDNGIGPLVCVGEATGAGGANVWTHIDMQEALADTRFPLDALPDGVRYTVAIRRAVRSAIADGVPIEDVGVPGIPYTMTRDDLEYSNRDLIAFCAKQLTAPG